MDCCPSSYTHHPSPITTTLDQLLRLQQHHHPLYGTITPVTQCRTLLFPSCQTALVHLCASCQVFDLLVRIVPVHLVLLPAASITITITITITNFPSSSDPRHQCLCCRPADVGPSVLSLPTPHDILFTCPPLRRSKDSLGGVRGSFSRRVLQSYSLTKVLDDVQLVRL
jgi:hypothetical protein